MNKELAKEIAKIQSNAIDKVVRLADKYGMDRNKLVLIYATVEYKTVLLGSFKDYELEEMNNE